MSEDSIVRIGDVWSLEDGISFEVAGFQVGLEGSGWACDLCGHRRMIVGPDGRPEFAGWTLVSRRGPEATLARLREIADFHADRGGTDLDRALRSLGR